MGVREDITAAIRRLLSDGQWHQVAEIHQAIKAAAPSGGALDVGFWMGPMWRAGICERFGNQHDATRKYRLTAKGNSGDAH
jgi:hypothetical protein